MLSSTMWLTMIGIAWTLIGSIVDAGLDIYCPHVGCHYEEDEEEEEDSEESEEEEERESEENEVNGAPSSSSSFSSALDKKKRSSPLPSIWNALGSCFM